MPVIQPQSNRKEDAIHADVIASLAQETHRPIPVVRRIFAAEYARLKAEARITDYLMLFTSKHTRDVLMHMGR